MADNLDAAFRQHWPRVVATLVRFTGSPDLAEEAAQEAFARAAAARDRELLLNPLAWLLTTGRRIAIDIARREAALRSRLPLLAPDEVAPEPPEPTTGDDRLDLLLVCCDPRLAPETRLALALRFVCGVPTAEIASLLLVSSTAMSARLTRAKRELGGGFRFGVEDPAARLADARATTHLLYTAGVDARMEGRPLGDELARTAVELARAIRRLSPGDPESAGLLALLLLTEARASTQVGPDGDLVPLDEADRSAWDRSLLEEGLGLAAVALREGGRFALQAGIAGLHSSAPSWEATDWRSIATLYDGLATVWPSPAARLARLVAHSYTDEGPGAALAELDDLEPPPALAAEAAAVRGDLLRRLGRPREAAESYEAAAAAEDRPPVRRFLKRRADEARRSRPGPGKRPGVDSPAS